LTPAQLEEIALSSSGCAAEEDALNARGRKNLRNCMLVVFDAKMI